MNLQLPVSSWFLSLPKNIDSIIFAIMGFIALWLSFRYNGVGISPDSVEYASIARNFRDHMVLNDLSAQPVVNFPCLYPSFIAAVLILTGADPFIAAPLINAFLFFVVIYLSGELTYRATNDRLCKWVILVTVLLSGVLLQVYTMLWSETLFIMFVLLFFQIYQNYKVKSSFRNLIILAIVTAMASITRYAGITLIATGLLMIFIDPNLDKRKKRNHFICFGFLASSLLITNLIRNYLLINSFTGWRDHSYISVTENISHYGSTLLSWLMLPGDTYYLTLGIGCLVLASALTILLCTAILKNNQQPGFLVILAFLLIYSLFIILMASIRQFEQIDDRLLSPLYVPLAIILVSGLYSTNRNKKSKKIIYALIISFALYINYNQYQDYVDWHNLASEYGIPGFTNLYWQHSDMAIFLRSNKIGKFNNIPFYSNWNEPVYFFSGKNCKLIPHFFSADQKNTFYNSKDFYLFWFDHLNNVDQAKLISLEDIKKIKKLTKILQLSDGSIYLCSQ